MDLVQPRVGRAARKQRSVGPPPARCEARGRVAAPSIQIVPRRGPRHPPGRRAQHGYSVAARPCSGPPALSSRRRGRGGGSSACARREGSRGRRGTGAGRGGTARSSATPWPAAAGLMRVVGAHRGANLAARRAEDGGRAATHGAPPRARAWTSPDHPGLVYGFQPAQNLSATSGAPS